MNTIIIEHADEKLTSLFRQMAEIAGVPIKIKTKPEKESKAISNPEILRAIKQYESGKVEGTTISPEDLKVQLEKMVIG
ncbi:hypothetical protein GCM10011386_11350 [Parapedobacter defluvii]|uniref:Antitoxin n=1 Tax=Parapedobacter defluvii TaxID=2045106 RepID=A0ABQ1LC19_9SPHI|nr:hypothetical protein [Parapedobacter defluvii]GGC21133.1 hypothetical protein GCM10011386_11350 [Parapedobacter defluvii]